MTHDGTYQCSIMIIYRTLFTILWGLYGVAAVLPLSEKNISYNILDIFSKNTLRFYGFKFSIVNRCAYNENNALSIDVISSEDVIFELGMNSLTIVNPLIH